MTNAKARFNKSHIRKVYACLTVTCHLHFWQNDRDFLRATAVTRGWNGYRNKSQHRSRPWRRKFSRRSSRDSNPRPFNHESGALTTELSPPPSNLLSWCFTFLVLLRPVNRYGYIRAMAVSETRTNRIFSAPPLCSVFYNNPTPRPF